jgi:hypothetical protein
MRDEARRHQSTDLYELLEVSPRASQEVIQAAYRALARNSHPDVSAGAGQTLGAKSDQRMRQLNAAYAVLGHAERRARYDFECALARRNQRAGRSEVRAVRPIAPEPRRVHVLPVAERARRVDQHFPMLDGGAILVLMAVVSLTALLLVLVWASLDPAVDDNPTMYSRPLVELAGR